MYMPHTEAAVEFADAFEDLVADQAEWSQATFGTDAERGPVGALKHLAKEALEAAEHPGDPFEYADCFLLILDAARRQGIKPMELIIAAKEKMKINKERSWPKPTCDEPVEHIKVDVVIDKRKDKRSGTGLDSGMGRV